MFESRNADETWEIGHLVRTASGSKTDMECREEVQRGLEQKAGLGQLWHED
jgi:hypothetical protein